MNETNLVAFKPKAPAVPSPECSASTSSKSLVKAHAKLMRDYTALKARLAAAGIGDTHIEIKVLLAAADLPADILRTLSELIRRWDCENQLYQFRLQNERQGRL